MSPISPWRSALDGALARLVLAPWQDDISWPRRRELLWELCDGGPFRRAATFAGETAWALASEGAHRFWHSPRQEQPHPAPAA